MRTFRNTFWGNQPVFVIKCFFTTLLVSPSPHGWLIKLNTNIMNHIDKISIRIRVGYRVHCKYLDYELVNGPQPAHDLSKAHKMAMNGLFEFYSFWLFKLGLSENCVDCSRNNEIKNTNDILVLHLSIDFVICFVVLFSNRFIFLNKKENR